MKAVEERAEEKVVEKNEEMPGVGRDDMVMHPLHYTANGAIECIDAIRASMRDDQYEGFLRGQCMKYLWRYRLKGNPIRDLKKGMFYWGRLMDLVGDLKYNHQD